MNPIESRKNEHLDICADEDVESRGGTLLDDVQLIHEALPELAFANVDTAIQLFGRRLQSPLLMSGMTGGSERAGEINLALASAAQKCGIGMGLGSQRAMWVDPELAHTYRVRSVAPDILLLSNLGAVQARDIGVAGVAELVEAVGADALCLHLNVAQELVQDEGDRDFRGCLASIEEIAGTLRCPVIAKETGCGFSRATISRLRTAGIRWIDTAGAGGTTWTGVEAYRGSPRQHGLGQVLREWGIPTAASIYFAREAGLGAIASGGIRGPLDVARSLVLGARAVGMALPFFRAYESSGDQGVLTLAEQVSEGLRSIMVLVGAESVEALSRVPFVMGPKLEKWTQPVTDLIGSGRYPAPNSVVSNRE